MVIKSPFLLKQKTCPDPGASNFNTKYKQNILLSPGGPYPSWSANTTWIFDTSALFENILLNYRPLVFWMDVPTFEAWGNFTRNICLLIWYCYRSGKITPTKSTHSNNNHASNIPKLILIAYPSFSQDSFCWDLSDVFWLSHSLPLGNWSRESKQIIFNLPRPWATPHFLHISDISFVAKIPEVKIVNRLRSDPSAVLI